MCTGLELAMMGLGAGGSMIQAGQQQRQQEAIVGAQNSRLNQFMDRNQQRQDEAAQLFASRKDAIGEEPATAARTAAVEERKTNADEAVAAAAPAAAAPIRGSAASVIGNVFDSASESAQGRAKARNDALATTAGFGDQLFGQGVASADTGRKLGTISGLAQSDASLLPHYQDLAGGAAAARTRPSGIGAMLSGLGQAGGYYLGNRAGAR